jgi:type IV pilus assembly protein PilO
MNVVEELKSLDVNDVGRWPLPFRVAVICIVFVAVVGMGVYWFIVQDKSPQLQRAQDEEQTLRISFENKQKKAANYDSYKAQLAQMEQSFGTMLQAEIPKDFYAEKPITISLSGGYHEIANFVSGVAALPRIVTLHDINITPDDQETFDNLTIQVTAKTYRYLEEEEAE